MELIDWREIKALALIPSNSKYDFMGGTKLPRL
jgi:hypothetical protein